MDKTNYSICYFYLVTAVNLWVQIERSRVQISAEKSASHIRFFLYSLRPSEAKSGLIRTIMQRPLILYDSIPYSLIIVPRRYVYHQDY